MKFFCIGDSESILGFELAGIAVKNAETAKEAKEAFQIALFDASIAVILVTDTVVSLLKNEISQHLKTSALPLVLEIPSRGKIPAEFSVGDFLKQTIGISA